MSIYRFYDCSGNLIAETTDYKKAQFIKQIQWIEYTVEKIEQN